MLLAVVVVAVAVAAVVVAATFLSALLPLGVCCSWLLLLPRLTACDGGAEVVTVGW